jgi:predicted nucleotidyltransferase component of viral defense system
MYALKGGCNLRFYFKSIRYSEDIDLDIWQMRKDTLFKNIHQILLGSPLKNILRSRDIEITKISSPKQTATTQRWKIEMLVNNQNMAHTKIEFSRRETEGNALLEAIDESIISRYHFPPILLNHYDRESAIKQKLSALINRKVTQARDIFDLYLLLSGFVKERSSLLKVISSAQIKLADSNLLSVKYKDFQSQVIAYLEEDYQKQYSDEKVWDLILGKVTHLLHGD